MAIVLEVSLTLNPGNQIAYLADDTGLVVGTEYVIAGTHLAADTRFTYNGNLDIVLTKQPIAVPQNNYVTPVSINTVPTAAVAPPVATYPYSVKNQLAASSLNLDLEFSPGPLPPKSALGGAGKFKYWVDTSTTIPSLRQCIVSRASATYNAAEWILLGTIDAAAHKFHFNGDVVDFVGGGGTSNIFNVTNLTVSGATNLTTLNVTGATTLTTLNVTGATTLTTLTLTGAATLPTITGPTTINGALTITGAAMLPTITGPTTINGGTTITGSLSAPTGINYTGTLGHAIGFGWDGYVHNYVDGTDVGRTVFGVSAGNGLSGGGSGGTVTLQMSGTYTGDFYSTRLISTGDTIAFGNVSTSGGGSVSGGAGNFSGNVSAGSFFTGGNGHFNSAIVDGTLTAASNGMTMGPGGSGRVLQMASGWYWDFNPGNGDLVWGGPSGAQFWVTRYSDHYCGNQIGPVFGQGAYINFSDVRGKTDIEPAAQGLIEILQLKPVTFKRTDQDRVELGFAAQDVEKILPEAVWPLTDGDGESRLGVSLDPIVATLVSAVQQLVARLEVLERA